MKLCRLYAWVRVRRIADSTLCKLLCIQRSRKDAFHALNAWVSELGGKHIVHFWICGVSRSWSSCNYSTVFSLVNLFLTHLVCLFKLFKIAYDIFDLHIFSTLFTLDRPSWHCLIAFLWTFLTILHLIIYKTMCIWYSEQLLWSFICYLNADFWQFMYVHDAWIVRTR